MEINFKRYFLYLCRWQLSTPILAVALILLSTMNKWVATIIANLIGGLLFFWVDKFIFRSKILNNQWEVKENIACVDCKKIARGYRLIKTPNYDRTKSKKIEFRCEDCSKKKTKLLRDRGIKI